MTDDKNEMKLKKYEMQVAYAMALGYDCAETAEKLDMDYVMVKYYAREIMDKTKAKNITNAVYILTSKGLI